MYSFQKLAENPELVFLGRHIRDFNIGLDSLSGLLLFGWRGWQYLSVIFFFGNSLVTFVNYIGLAVFDQLLLHCLIRIKLFFGSQKLVQRDVPAIFNKSVKVNHCLAVHQGIQTWRLLHAELFAQHLHWHYIEVAPLYFKSHENI